METESKGKIIASPKVVAQDKKKAVLETIDTTSFREVEVSDNGAIGVEFKEISASIKLEVTPQVTNEGSIFLEIAVTKEHFSTAPSADAPPDVAKRKIETSVLVDSGSTIVLGGVYNYTKLESQSGVPFLKDIPLIGWLFRTPYNPSTNKTEMIIFMTPRVINAEESGIVDKG
jgi:type IV pilus assembly protein PilQ